LPPGLPIGPVLSVTVSGTQADARDYHKQSCQNCSTHDEILL